MQSLKTVGLLLLLYFGTNWQMTKSGRPTMGNTDSSANAITNNGNGPSTESTTMLSRYFSSATESKPKFKVKLSKDEKIQQLLENEIKSREADIKMLRIRATHNRQMMMADLKNGNKQNAYQYHKTTKSIELQISKIQACVSKLNAELSAIYEHAMHARTMDLMKQTSRHFVNSSVSSAGSVENAIAYADALADAHAAVEEVGDALNFSGSTTISADDDEEWQSILKSIEEPPDTTSKHAPAYSPPVVDVGLFPATPLKEDVLHTPKATQNVSIPNSVHF